MAQLAAGFHVAAARDKLAESLRAEVFRRVVNFRAGLYPFPDPERIRKVD